jgi:uncharacterized protein (DUF885 family)
MFFRIFLPAIVIVVLTASAADNPASKSLHALFDREWDYEMRQDPVWASILGDRRWNDEWADHSAHSHFMREKHYGEVLKELAAFNVSFLSAEDRLNYDLFQYSVQKKAERLKLMIWLMPMNHRWGIQTANQNADALRFETEKDYEDWIRRMIRFPQYVDQTIAVMKQGIIRKILQPKVVMQRVPRQLDKQIVADPEQSPFYQPFRKFPQDLPARSQLRLETEAWTAIKEHVVPAFEKLRKFLTREYIPACFDSVGAWQWPHGARAYDFLAKDFTTTALTPAQIHEIGLSEVKRIRNEMEGIRSKVGFVGDLPAFFEHLRTDEKFFFRTGDELLQSYRSMSRVVDPLMVKLFRTLPRTPYGIEKIPDLTAPDTTTAYYRWPAPDGSRAGTYFVNLYQPETRPKWEMMALSLHEAVPGHHLQIALAQELKSLPKFRRHLNVTAYQEGWGLYAESLGAEVGLYDNPYDKFGQLTYEMWRAVRLVVDTGIHAKRWERKRAIDFFMENAPKTRQDVVNEVDRYISWPGQALAYKIGQMKIQELRRRAAAALGSVFDVRVFHDEVLLSGAVPLAILEKRIDGWIATQKSVRKSK